MKKQILTLVLSICTVSILNAQLKVTSTGNVGIGPTTMTPSTALTVLGRLNVYSSSSTANFEITCGAGDPRITTDNTKFVFYKKNGTGYVNIECGTLSELSDSSSKTNIKKISISSLDAIKKINGYTYNWKTDSKGKKQVGLIAKGFS